MRKRSKSNSEKFAQQIGAHLNTLGAKTQADDEMMNWAVYLLATKLGYLTFRIPKEDQTIWTIWGRFDITQTTQPESLKEFGANKHSGKWNIHLSDSLNLDEAVEACKARLEVLKTIV